MADLPDPSLLWPIIPEGVALIASYEQCRLHAYPDPATGGEPYTCGWGETEGVSFFTVWTQQQADARFQQSLMHFVGGVLQRCSLMPTPYELAALVSLAYNIGLTAFGGSTALRLHNKGDWAGAARGFLLFNKVRDKRSGKLVPWKGLTARRSAEASLYLRVPHDPLPRAVSDPGLLARARAAVARLTAPAV